MIDTRRFLAALVACCCALLAFASVASAQERLYGATGGPTASNLYLLNPASGAVAQTLGPIGFAVTGLAIDPSTRTLYGSTSFRDPSARRSLITIDKTTGAGTLVGNLGVGDVAADLTFTPDGTLYGWLEGVDDLVTIDKATGAASIVGNSGLSTEGSGLASDSAGTLFFAGDREDSANGPLRTVDRNTGLTTVVATLSGASPTTDQIAALAFNSAGTLFGVGADNTSPNPSELLTINTATAAINIVGPSINRLDAIVFETTRPTSKAECKKGGWRDFEVFKNQGDCVSFVATGGKNPPSG